MSKVIALTAGMLLVLAPASAGEVTVSVVADRAPGPAATHGRTKLLAALQAKGSMVEQASDPVSARGKLLVVAGLASGPGAAAQLLQGAGLAAPAGTESLLIQHTKAGDKPALLIAGSDDRGLMYALLDVANRVGWSADPTNPLREVRDIREKPAVSERALSKYTFHRATFESYFHDERYWARYLDVLAENRFNTFVLIFGYENWGYFAPPYPYFFDVEGFPDIRVVGITKEEQQRNLVSLNRLIAMTHARGLNFTLGIWDHIYRGGVQGPKEYAEKPTPGLVWGLTPENLRPYTKAALAKFLRQVPHLDTVQFRMHDESGLKPAEMTAFWSDLYDVMNTSGRGIRFDARIKGLPDSLIDSALEKGVNLRLCTKFWAEQLGLPFHPTHINARNQFERRHSYADLLRYPQRYRMHWRLWNGGTTRVLLWGDPEYARRFTTSTHLYDGDGFEVNEPLATKMQAQLHDQRPFDLLRPPYRYYDWEFERYWHFFQVFGRVGYNPETPPEVWQREFQRRFGPEAGPEVEEALHRASQVLPRIVATCFPYTQAFPMTRGWVEKQRREDLPTYAKAETSDTEQFLSYDDAAQCQITGAESPKVWPQQTSQWFARASTEILARVGQAERLIGDHRNKEFNTTIVDLKILAYLALYHSRRSHAAFSWNLFERTGDLHSLDEAIRHESRAARAWEKIVEAAGDVYHDDLLMGRRSVGLCGHWKDELAAMKKGLKILQQQRTNFHPAVKGEAPSIAHVPVRKTPPEEDLAIWVTASGKTSLARVTLAYRSGRGDYHNARMEQTEPNLYRAVIPGSAVLPGLSYFMEAVDEAGQRSTFPKQGPEAPLIVTVTRNDTPPVLEHQPVTSAPASRPLQITARVRDPSGVKWVRLRYRSVNQHQDYKTLPMLPTGANDCYQAEVPAEHVVPHWDFMYFIEVMDNHGNGKIYPDLEKETPYVVVKLYRDRAPH